MPEAEELREEDVDETETEEKPKGKVLTLKRLMMGVPGLDALDEYSGFRGKAWLECGRLVRRARDELEQLGKARQTLIKEYGEEGESGPEIGRAMAGWAKFEEEYEELLAREVVFDVEPIGVGKNQKDLPGKIASSFPEFFYVKE